MDVVMTQVLSAGVTALLTAFLTSYATSKANERVLRDIMDRVEAMEMRVYNHETRLSKLEGKVNGSVAK